MTKQDLCRHEEETAERVIAHAQRQRARGRNPSMTYLGEGNPRRALVLAKLALVQINSIKALAEIGKQTLSLAKYPGMTDWEILSSVVYITSTSSSKEELLRRLKEELEYPHEVMTRVLLPKNQAGKTTREILRGIGGVIMADGSMSRVKIKGHNNFISI